ncbi:MAG: SRPBCC family protein, partial [Actinomycetota bacterium]
MAEIRFVESLDIAAPIQKVWAYRLDFNNLPDYNPNVSNFRQVAGTGPGVGSEYLFDIVMAKGFPPMETPIKVVQARAPD